MEALKRLAPRKALGPFDVSAGPLLTDQPASENGPSSRINTVSRSAFPVTSGPAEDAQTWFPIKGSRAPLDLSLKHMARFTSPDSLHWCVHNLHFTTQSLKYSHGCKVEMHGEFRFKFLACRW